jgi:hypothetical protein
LDDETIAGDIHRQRAASRVSGQQSFRRRVAYSANAFVKITFLQQADRLDFFHGTQRNAYHFLVLGTCEEGGLSSLWRTRFHNLWHLKYVAL